MKKTEGKHSAKNKKSMNRTTKKALKIVVSVVVICGLLFAYVATGAVRGGLLSYFQVPQKTLTGITVTNNDDKTTKLTPGQYNYYYTSAYNQIYSTVKMYQQYGLDVSSLGYDVDFSKALEKQVKETKDDGTKVTWADYLEEQVEESIKNTVVFYNAAVANNEGNEPALTEEEQSKIDEQIDSFKESAKEKGYTLDAYIKAVYGKGVTEKVVREEMKKATIAANYQNELNTQVEDLQFTVEQAQEYFNNHTDLLSSVDAQVFSAKDEAAAKKMLEAVNANNSDQGFADAAAEASETDYYKDAYKNPAKTISTNLMKKTAQSRYSTMSEEGLNWLYSSERNVGDTAVYGNYVVRVIKPIYKSELPTVTVRHILVAPETEDDANAINATAEQWEAAKTKADDILNQWKAGGANEDAFSALTADNSDDSGSASSGGLIENAYPGQMVSEFDNWIFGQRKTGDIEIVRTDYGYHLIYFVSVNETPYWQTAAVDGLREDAMGEKLDGTLEQYEVKVNWLGSKFFIDDKSLAS